jgi:hypothetical protein
VKYGAFNGSALVGVLIGGLWRCDLGRGNGLFSQARQHVELQCGRRE